MSGLGEFFYFVGIVDYAVFIGSLEIIIIQLSGYGYCLRSSCRSPAIRNKVSDILSTTGSNKYS